MKIPPTYQHATLHLLDVMDRAAVAVNKVAQGMEKSDHPNENISDFKYNNKERQCKLLVHFVIW